MALECDALLLFVEVRIDCRRAGVAVIQDLADEVQRGTVLREVRSSSASKVVEPNVGEFSALADPAPDPVNVDQRPAGQGARDQIGVVLLARQPFQYRDDGRCQRDVVHPTGFREWQAPEP